MENITSISKTKTTTTAAEKINEDYIFISSYDKKI